MPNSNAECLEPRADLAGLTRFIDLLRSDQDQVGLVDAVTEFGRFTSNQLIEREVRDGAVGGAESANSGGHAVDRLATNPYVKFVLICDAQLDARLSTRAEVSHPDLGY